MSPRAWQESRSCATPRVLMTTCLFVFLVKGSHVQAADRCIRKSGAEHRGAEAADANTQVVYSFFTPARLPLVTPHPALLQSQHSLKPSSGRTQGMATARSRLGSPVVGEARVCAPVGFQIKGTNYLRFLGRGHIYTHIFQCWRVFAIASLITEHTNHSPEGT